MMKSTVQPIHVVYGGANLFTAETVPKLGRMAIKSLETYAPNEADWAAAFNIRPHIVGEVRERVLARLQTRAVEDFRVDFEDGYGIRPDAEEDNDAQRTADETAKAMSADQLPPFFGIRIRSFSDQTQERAARTLDLYLTRLVETAEKLPESFCVTLPKVHSPEQAAALAGRLDQIENKLGITRGSIKIEIMVETPTALVASDGTFTLRRIVDAAMGRCRGAHFGAYDYTASLGITSSSQTLFHPACDFARNMMQISLADSGVWLSDGATNVMPLAIHRGEKISDEQKKENADAVQRGWSLHVENCRRSLDNGFYQGWDLHPAQIPARLAAVFSFYLEHMDDASQRLRGFVERMTQASMVGAKFDDAATGEGLLNYFSRGLNCGAITVDEATVRTGLTIEELNSWSFAEIVDARRK